MYHPPSFSSLRIQKGSEETKSSSDSIPGTTNAVNAPSADQKTPKLPDIPPTDSEDEGETKGKAAATPKASTPPPKYNAPSEDDFESLTKRFEALKKR